jgi:hypothetical protein
VSTTASAERWYAAIAIAVIALFALVFIAFPPAEHYFGYDIWEHAASVKQLMANPFHPLHPEYSTYDSSRQYMPWNLLFALSGRLLRMSPLGVLALESIATTAVLLMGVYLFFCEYFRNEWAPIAGLFCLLILWGKPIVWSSFYDLWSYLMTAAYPSTFVFATGFLVWWLGIRAIRKRSFPTGEGIGIALLAAVIVLAHQMSGAFVIAGLFCFVVAEPGGRWPRKTFILVCAVIGLALTKFWPYFDPWQIAGKSQLTNPLWGSDKSGNFYRPLVVFAFLGPAIAGLAALCVFVRRRIYLGVVLGFSGSMLVYLVGGIAGHPVAYRLLIVWILYLHIACAWLLLAIFAGESQPAGEVLRIGNRTRRTITAAMALLLLVQVGYVVCKCAAYLVPPSQVARLPHPMQFEDVKGTMRALTPHLSEKSIVFADEVTSIVLPAFTARVTTFYRASPYVPDDMQRFRDGKRFFAPDTSRTERLRLLKKYSAAYVLYSDENVSASTKAELGEIAKPEARANSFVLLKVVR